MLRQACGYKLANDGHDTRAIQASRRLARRCTESCNLVKWVRGKASAERVAHLCFFGIFGNYATGGALNFHTRTGAQVNGFEIGADAGSFGYFNNYMTVGQKTGPLEYSLFASDVRGEGFIANSASMVMSADGKIGDHTHLTNQAAKGRSGRVIALNKELKKQLAVLVQPPP